MWKTPDSKFTPLNAPVAGYESGVPGVNGLSPVFIIRAKYRDGIHPGKWVFGNTALISWGGEEHCASQFEIYTGPVKWVAVKGKAIPPEAIVGGHEADGRKLYIARAKFEKGIFTGKAGTHLAKGCCVGYMGKEYAIEDYEVLVYE